MNASGSTVGQRAGAYRGALARTLTSLLVLLDEIVEHSLDGTMSDANLAEAFARARLEDVGDEHELRLALCRFAFDDHRLREVPPHAALRAALHTLAALGGARDGSVWASSPGGMRCVARHGPEPTRRVKTTARGALTSESPVGLDGPGAIVGLPIRRWGMVAGALVVRLPGADRTLGAEAAALAARSLGSVLERSAMLEENSARDQLLIESANRKLARLTLDMHDGPVQDVIALLSDVRLYKSQLKQHLVGHPNAELLVGRADDFEARLLAIDDELRQFARSFESPSLLERPFAEAIQDEIEPTRKAGVQTSISLELDASILTPSQRIALLRIVQEGLSNVRDHSGAAAVSVSVIDHGSHVTLRMTDDGAGFNVERTLVRAARGGRLGLVGMAERVRLLGGTFDIDSSPGTGTTIAVTLPRWTPLTDRAD